MQWCQFWLCSNFVLASALQAYVARLAGLLQLSNGNEDSEAGKQVEVSLLF